MIILSDIGVIQFVQISLKVSIKIIYKILRFAHFAIVNGNSKSMDDNSRKAGRYIKLCHRQRSSFLFILKPVY